MPTYDYRCRTCGKQFEYHQSMSSPKLTNCLAELCSQPIKGTGEVERLISKGAGIIFSGSGFYQTDYVRTADGTPISNSPKPTSESPAPTTSESKDSTEGVTKKQTESDSTASVSEAKTPSTVATTSSSVPTTSDSKST